MTKQVGGGNAPICPSCEKNDMVRRMWRGKQKMWYCDLHFLVTSTKKKEASLWQRITHRLPEPDTMRYSEIFPNRAARRSRRAR